MLIKGEGQMKKVGEILSVLFDKETLDKARGYKGLFASWEEVVKACGVSGAAAHSRIAALARGVARIEADHPGWVQILQAKQRPLLRELGRCFPGLGITGIAFRLSRSPLFPPEPPVSAGVLAPQEEAGEPEGIRAALYENIRDEDFKNILKKLEQHLTDPPHP